MSSVKRNSNTETRARKIMRCLPNFLMREAMNAILGRFRLPAVAIIKPILIFPSELFYCFVCFVVVLAVLTHPMLTDPVGFFHLVETKINDKVYFHVLYGCGFEFIFFGGNKNESMIFHWGQYFGQLWVKYCPQ